MSAPSNKPWHFYLINLERSPDRLESQKQQFEKLNLPWTRVSAIDGKNLLPELKGLDKKGYDFRHGKTINPNELGCYLSHYNAIEAFVASEHHYGIILEDDAVLADEIEEVLDALVHTSNNWDVANLNGRHSGRPIRQMRLTENHRLVAYLFRRTGGAGYMINRKAAKAYLQKLLPMKVPYDHEFDRAWIYGFRYRGVQPTVMEGATDAVSSIGYRENAIGMGVKKSQWQRGSVFVYRFWNESARLMHYTLRALFIPRGG